MTFNFVAEREDPDESAMYREWNMEMTIRRLRSSRTLGRSDSAPPPPPCNKFSIVMIGTGFESSFESNQTRELAVPGSMLSNVKSNVQTFLNSS